ncbi:FkbM family methyltransferase [Lutimaribacter marinistellae]|uniref:FkbM family methyltransferase n=1 Tax=Lutimaribacter marinistellae TaxID=1820329 RepID=A0ABV7TLN0_9RHOB
MPAPRVQQPESQERFITSRGIRFPLEAGLIPWRLRKALRSNSYEHREAEAALKLIGKDDVVMELGAGIGFMSTLIATQTPASSVHAFEANPRLIPYIRRVHAENEVSNATVHHGVLGEAEGSAGFYVRPRILDSSLAPMADDSEEVELTEVPVLDARSCFDKVSPTILVCDIEGAEVDLLPLLDLSGLRGMVIELHPQFVGKEGIDRVFSHLHSCGLVFFPRFSDRKVAVFRSDW